MTKHTMKFSNHILAVLIHIFSDIKFALTDLKDCLIIVLRVLYPLLSHLPVFLQRIQANCILL